MERGRLLSPAKHLTLFHKKGAGKGNALKYSFIIQLVIVLLASSINENKRKININESNICIFG